jgi:hypothetical protein
MRATKRYALMLCALGCVLTAWPSAGAQAGLHNQSSATPTSGDVVTEEALTCWWRTTVAAVRVGEPFSVVLTCSALNTPTVIVVPDESRLDPKAVQFPPFEVLTGARAPDLGNDQRRFLQYRYDLRVIADDRFGRDLKLAPLTVNYRIRSRSSDGTLSEGQDQAYQLPALSMRVLSTVADDAADIRGGSTALFEEIDARSFRSTLLREAGALFFALSALALIATVVQLVRRRPAAQRTDERRVPAWLVHRGVARAFGDVERARQANGWTPELVAQALAAMRMVAAYVVTSPMTLRPLRSNAVAAPGTVTVPAQWSHRRTASASSPATPQIVADVRSKAAAQGADPAYLQKLEDVKRALSVFTRARYGRDVDQDDAALDEALAIGCAQARVWRPDVLKWLRRPRRSVAGGWMDTRLGSE